jgi:predicted aconitase with swiveling domain
MFHTTRLTGMAPIGMLYNVTTTKAALGAVVMRIPTMTDFDSDPLEHIETGDWVRIDADKETVSVWKGGRR